MFSWSKDTFLSAKLVNGFLRWNFFILTARIFFLALGFFSLGKNSSVQAMISRCKEKEYFDTLSRKHVFDIRNHSHGCNKSNLTQLKLATCNFTQPKLKIFLRSELWSRVNALRISPEGPGFNFQCRQYLSENSVILFSVLENIGLAVL